MLALQEQGLLLTVRSLLLRSWRCRTTQSGRPSTRTHAASLETSVHLQDTTLQGTSPSNSVLYEWILSQWRSLSLRSRPHRRSQHARRLHLAWHAINCLPNYPTTSGCPPTCQTRLRSSRLVPVLNSSQLITSVSQLAPTSSSPKKRIRTHRVRWPTLSKRDHQLTYKQQQSNLKTEITMPNHPFKCLLTAQNNIWTILNIDYWVVNIETDWFDLTPIIFMKTIVSFILLLVVL